VRGLFSSAADTLSCRGASAQKLQSPEPTHYLAHPSCDEQACSDEEAGCLKLQAPGWRKGPWGAWGAWGAWGGERRECVRQMYPGSCADAAYTMNMMLSLRSSVTSAGMHLRSVQSIDVLFQQVCLPCLHALYVRFICI